MPSLENLYNGPTDMFIGEIFKFLRAKDYMFLSKNFFNMAIENIRLATSANVDIQMARLILTADKIDRLNLLSIIISTFRALNKDICMLIMSHEKQAFDVLSDKELYTKLHGFDTDEHECSINELVNCSKEIMETILLATMDISAIKDRMHLHKDTSMVDLAMLTIGNDKKYINFNNTIGTVTIKNMCVNGLCNALRTPYRHGKIFIRTILTLIREEFFYSHGTKNWTWILKGQRCRGPILFSMLIYSALLPSNIGNTITEKIIKYYENGRIKKRLPHNLYKLLYLVPKGIAIHLIKHLRPNDYMSQQCNIDELFMGVIYHEMFDALKSILKNKHILKNINAGLFDDKFEDWIKNHSIQLNNMIFEVLNDERKKEYICIIRKNSLLEIYNELCVNDISKYL